MWINKNKFCEITKRYFDMKSIDTSDIYGWSNSEYDPRSSIERLRERHQKRVEKTMN